MCEPEYVETQIYYFKEIELLLKKRYELITDFLINYIK